MQIPDLLAVQLLKKAGKLSDEQFERLKAELKTQLRPVQHLAIAEGLISEAELAALYARELDTVFVEVRPQDIAVEHLQKIPEATARRLQAFVFDFKDGTWLVATTDPANPAVANFLQKLLGDKVKLYLTTPAVLADTLEFYHHQSAHQLPGTMSSHQSESHQPADEVVAETFEAILNKAVALGASDIHIEPGEHVGLIRFRVGGQLQAGPKLPLHSLAAVASYCKAQAGLTGGLDHGAGSPRAGSFAATSQSQTYTISVATLPVLDGEKVTLHLHGQAAGAADLETLGFKARDLRTIQEALAQPHGLVLVTGPRGDARSMLLRSILAYVGRPGLHLATLEQNITARIPDASQTIVNEAAGLGYAKALRGVLKQNPDIVMLDSLPDAETVRLAVRAASDGCMVLGALPPADPSTTVARLESTGIEPFLLAQSLQLIVDITPGNKDSEGKPTYQVLRPSQADTGQARVA